MTDASTSVFRLSQGDHSTLMPLHSGAADVALGTSRWQVMMIPSAEGWAVEALLLEGPGQAVAASLTMELPDWDEDSALCWPGAFYGGHP